MLDLMPVTTFELLAAVDQLRPNEHGAFVMEADDGSCLGSLLVAGNRVCWAAAVRLRGRLRDLLHACPERSRLLRALALDDLDLVGHSTSDETVAFASDAAGAAFKQHTVESLIALDGIAARTTWVPHRRGGYNAHFTFSPTELLAAVGGQLYADEMASAEQVLSQIVPRGAVGASFAIDEEGQPVAVHEVAGDRLSLDALIDLGDWVAAALGATPGFSAAIMERVAATVTGPAALGWRTGRRMIHAAVIDDPRKLARAMAEVEHRGHPAVLSARAPSAPRKAAPDRSGTTTRNS